jgi:hypothetical protein
MRKTKNSAKKCSVFLTPEQRQKIEEMRDGILSRYRHYVEGKKKRAAPREIQQWIRNLQKGALILRRLQVIFDSRQLGGPYQHYGEAAYAHDQAIEFLSHLPHSRNKADKKHGGRPVHFHLREAAYCLAVAFMEFTGEPHWGEVARILTEWFPEVKRDDQHRRDSGDWAQSLAQHYMRLMEDPAKRQKALAMLIAPRISNRQSLKPPPENFEQTLVLLTHAPRRQKSLSLKPTL